jgi:hypothetical protein
MSGRNPIFQSKVTDFSQSKGSEQEASGIEVLSNSSGNDSDTEDLSLSPRQAPKRSLSTHSNTSRTSTDLFGRSDTHVPCKRSRTLDFAEDKSSAHPGSSKKDNDDLFLLDEEDFEVTESDRRRFNESISAAELLGLALSPVKVKELSHSSKPAHAGAKSTLTTSAKSPATASEKKPARTPSSSSASLLSSASPTRRSPAVNKLAPVKPNLSRKAIGNPFLPSRGTGTTKSLILSPSKRSPIKNSTATGIKPARSPSTIDPTLSRISAVESTISKLQLDLFPEHAGVHSSTAPTSLNNIRAQLSAAEDNIAQILDQVNDNSRKVNVLNTRGNELFKKQL